MSARIRTTCRFVTMPAHAPELLRKVFFTCIMMITTQWTVTHLHGKLSGLQKTSAQTLHRQYHPGIL